MSTCLKVLLQCKTIQKKTKYKKETILRNSLTKKSNINKSQCVFCCLFMCVY